MFTFEVGVSLRLDLRGAAASSGAGSPSAFTVRELGRDEVEPTLGAAPALARRALELDQAAPAGWRCFVAEVVADGAPVHVNFVETRPGRPLLFGGVTVPAARGRGAFRATIRFIAARLAEEGEPALFSAMSAFNRASARAHDALGFVIVSRRLDARVRGVSLRGVARRLLRGA